MRILRWLLLIPIAGFSLYLALANRHDVLFSLDPFTPETPALALQLPLILVIFLSILVGLLLGGASAWARQGKWRKEARQGRRDVKRLSDEIVDSSENLPVPTTAPDRTV